MRRVIAKVEWHPGELYPRVGFIVTNLSRPADRVVAFYNKRGTCEQWIKEGKGAIKWTRLSCRTFAANAVRLQLHALAYNLGNFLRTLATPEPIKDWSLTSLKEKLIKIGAKVVSHGRYVVFQMAEVAIPRQMFQEILRLIADYGRSHHPRQHEAFDCHAFKRNRQEECVQMPVKIARSAPRPSFGLPELLVAIQPRVSLAARPEKREYLALIWKWYGESSNKQFMARLSSDAAFIDMWKIAIKETSADNFETVVDLARGKKYQFDRITAECAGIKIPPRTLLEDLSWTYLGACSPRYTFRGERNVPRSRRRNPQSVSTRRELPARHPRPIQRASSKSATLPTRSGLRSCHETSRRWSILPSSSLPSGSP